METNNQITNQEENPIRYKFKVANNHPVVLAAKKQTNKRFGILSLVAAVIFAVMLGLSMSSNNPSVWVGVIFGGFTVLALICSIYFFTSKESKNDKIKSREFIFFEHSFAIIEHNENTNKEKAIIKCLYSSYANKQYISKFIETNIVFTIKVLTGTYNGMPQYKQFAMPKEIVNAETMEEFKNFVKERVGKGYQVK